MNLALDPTLGRGNSLVPRPFLRSSSKRAWGRLEGNVEKEPGLETKPRPFFVVHS